jgi:LytS/YehU family sensor histidine kinase
MDKGPWIKTLNRSLHFPALSPGKRFFEVQAQNEGGQWSESASLHFVVNPSWWATWWAKTLYGLSLLTLISGIYIYRTQQLKKTYKIQLQMAELERSALQAQMNPHFIFNCLNSIQNYILQNEKESAIIYLGSFAKLIRSMLNASVAGKISLNEELQLLDNYLKMEKLRFKNRFEYEIDTSGIFDIYDIKIPPLLVQPFIENAVQHGISGRKNGGKVSVFFKEQGSFLLVTIEDNGGGIQPLNDKKLHKSFGMSITRNRLNLLSGKKGLDFVRTETLLDEEGQNSGTRVLIRIDISANAHQIESSK